VAHFGLYEYAGPLERNAWLTEFESYRNELIAHCYRMLGSAHEAEDLVQDTMLRAWRAREQYDATKSSVRTWLYKIATNVCLTALEGRSRRPLPSGLGAPSEDPEAPLTPSFDIPWLQPFPDARFDPAARAAQRGTLRLALVAAMQLLPPKQRAVLILRDVLEFSAAEVAEMLGTSAAAINSALQRARAGLSGVDEDQITESGGAAMVDRYMQAFEAADVDALVGLLTREAVMEMPPVPLWYSGPINYGRFLHRLYAMRGRAWRTVRLTANAQPAMAAYCRAEDGSYQLHTLQVFTVTPEGIAHNVVFADPQVFAAFGLDRTLL
jgi:RNA polymerase sigma-70 factor, ECF subfamily